MDLARDEEARVRNLGRLALEKAAKAGASKAGSNGISRTFATVSRVNGDGTIDVSMGDYTDVNGVTSECILRGLRMTVACSSAQVGDRVIVDTYAHVSVVTGILANADNGPYVMLYDTVNASVKPGTKPVTINGGGNLAEFAYLEVYGSTGEWKRCYCKVPRAGDSGYNLMYFTLIAFNGSGTNVYIKMTDFEITHDSAKWSIAPIAYNEMSTGGKVLEAIGTSIVRVVGVRG